MQYLAVTIGPVVKTLMEARKTRELWAGSYLLSRLMEHLCEALDPSSQNILIPYFPKDIHNRNRYGAGLYPDRLFMQAEDMKSKEVEKKIDLAFEKLAEECLLPSDWESESEKIRQVKDAVSFWKKFFRVRFVIKELANINDGALTRELTPYLENAELEDTLFPEEPDIHELYRLFDHDANTNKLRLYSASISNALRGDQTGIYQAVMSKGSFFPATHEIAALELFKEADGILFKEADKHSKEIEENNDAFYQLMENEELLLNLHQMARHKYFCIVHADGDSISKVLQQLNDGQDYKDFSARLAQFGLDAADKINQFGGKPIYIGGDDLLFLAPVMNGEQTIFHLINELDTIFPNKYKEQHISLSYGINMVYYKFPLFEAIADAYDLLSRSKSYKNNEGLPKNALSFQLTKHSGTYFNATSSKAFLQTMLKAIDAFQQSGAGEKAGLISSLMFKVDTLSPLLDSMAIQEFESYGNNANLEDRLGHFFQSYFNEWENAPDFENQCREITALLMAAHKEAGLGRENWLQLFYSVIRIIDFITEPNKIQQYDFEDKLTATE